jgi:hypothetical protein
LGKFESINLRQLHLQKFACVAAFGFIPWLASPQNIAGL